MAGDTVLSTDVGAAAHYCRELAAPDGSDFYYATLFHSPAERRLLNAIFALKEEAMPARSMDLPPETTLLRLAWWQDEIIRSLQGKGSHPLAAELHHLRTHVPFDTALLIECLAAFGRHVQGSAAPRDFPSWIDDHTRSIGGFWQLAVRACGVQHAAALQAAACAGGVIASFDELRASARWRDPGAPDRLLPHQQGQDASMRARSLLPALERSLDDAARQLSAESCRGLMFCITGVRLRSVLLGKLRRTAAQNSTDRIALTPLHKLWIAWRCRIS